MNEIDWIIHYVSETNPWEEVEETIPENDKVIFKGFDAFGNIHTHGLNQHNHREICIPFKLPPDTAMDILNRCGLRIVHDSAEFKEGIDHSVLSDGYDAKFISFDNDPTLYLILPDENNKFPGDEDCQYPYNQQEIYAKIISDDKGYV